MDSVYFERVVFPDELLQRAEAPGIAVNLPDVRVAQTLTEALRANGTPLDINEVAIVEGALDLKLKNHVNVLLAPKDIVADEAPEIEFKDKFRRDTVGLLMDPDPDVDSKYVDESNLQFWSAVLVSNSIGEVGTAKQELAKLRESIRRRSTATKIGSAVLNGTVAVSTVAAFVNIKLGIPSLVINGIRSIGAVSRWRADRMRRPLENLHFDSDEFEDQVAKTVGREAEYLASKYPVINLRSFVENVEVSDGRL